MKIKKYVNRNPITPDPRGKKSITSNGKRNTIYTPNPNDPRLKAYSDSLSLYKKTVDIENPKYYEDGEPSWWKFKGSQDEVGEFMRKNNIDFNHTGRFPGKIQPESTGYFGEGILYPKYKKPVQPVEYKPSEKATVKPKDVSFSVKKKDFGPKKSLPKSINSVKYDASGANVYLTVNGKTSVMPKKEFTSWLKNSENRDMFDSYRKSTAKK